VVRFRLLPSGERRRRTEGVMMAKLYWAVCDICDFTGNAYDDQAKANDELGEHMRHHASAGESGNGRLEESD
jgi:hypothetical protein